MKKTDAVTIKTSPDKVELAKALLKHLYGRITEAEFISFANVLGYAPCGHPAAFKEYAFDQTITMLS